jgi:hypothetical protein
MYSQIVRLDEGNIKLYINQSKEEHDNVISSLKFEGFKNSTRIEKKSDRVYDVWYLYQDSMS